MSGRSVFLRRFVLRSGQQALAALLPLATGCVTLRPWSVATDLLGPSEDPAVDLDLATIEQPTLAVWGAEDELIPAAAARDRFAELQHGRFVEIPECDHSPMEERPERFPAVVEPFLGGE